MEKSINIHRALRTTPRLLLTSILSIVFGAVGVVVGLLAKIVAGILRNVILSHHTAQATHVNDVDIHSSVSFPTNF